MKRKIKIVLNQLLFFILINFVCSCDSKIYNSSLKDKSLDSYYHEKGKPIGGLLACGCLEEDAGNPILTTIFYPNNSVNDYQLFITDTICENKNDLRCYYSVPIKIDSLFKGKLLRIDQELPSTSVFVMFISDAIKVDSPVIETERALSFVSVDSLNGRTTFRWGKRDVGQSKAFLTVISNKVGDIRSCSYTTNNYFQLDNLTDADRIIYPLDEKVQIHDHAELLWMDVNEDNWITKLTRITFKGDKKE